MCYGHLCNLNEEEAFWSEDPYVSSLKLGSNVIWNCVRWHLLSCHAESQQLTWHREAHHQILLRLGVELALLRSFSFFRRSAPKARTTTLSFFVNKFISAWPSFPSRCIPAKSSREHCDSICMLYVFARVNSDGFIAHNGQFFFLITYRYAINIYIYI